MLYEKPNRLPQYIPFPVGNVGTPNRVTEQPADALPGSVFIYFPLVRRNVREALFLKFQQIKLV